MTFEFKFKTRYGYTKIKAQLIGNKIKFILSPLKNYRPFPVECFAEYNKMILKKQRKASLVIISECNKILESEFLILKQRAIELLPVPYQAIDLVFGRLSKGDYSVFKHTL